MILKSSGGFKAETDWLWAFLRLPGRGNKGDALSGGQPAGHTPAWLCGWFELKPSGMHPEPRDGLHGVGGPHPIS